MSYTGEEDKQKLKNEFFNLLIFLIIAARNCVKEPKLYGPLRLVDGASRLIEILGKMDMEDTFLQGIKEKIDTGKYLVMEDEGEFIKFLDDLTLDVADALKE